MSLRMHPTELAGVQRVEPDVYTDDRGYFMETFHQRRYEETGIRLAMVQTNLSRSVRGVLRGLHYQLQRPQAKLVQVIRGEIFDVAADIRTGSPTFGRWTGHLLSENNHRQLFIPEGFAHGFLVLSDVADVLYHCTDFYTIGDEYGVRWNDPDLAVDWPDCERIFSLKDASLPLLATLDTRLLPAVRPAEE